MVKLGVFLVPLVMFCSGLAAQYTSTSITNDYASNDISTTGTLLTGGASTDDGEEVVNFPGAFSFDFYGTNFTSVTVNSNGWVYFGASQGLTASQMRNPPTTTPNAAIPNNFISPLYDDLDPAGNLGSPGEVRVELLSAPSRFVIHFDVFAFASTTNRAVMALVLYATGEIEAHYAAAHNFVGGTAVGVENSAGTVATAGPNGFTTNPAASDAYRWDPPVVNDPEIDVQRPAGAVNSKPSTMTDDIGALLAGAPTTFTWTIENQGATNSLNIASIAAAPSGVANVTVTATPTLVPSGAIAPSGTASFDVDVTPAGAGPFEFTITVGNDDANENPYTIVVQGTGLVPQTLPFLENFDTWTTDTTLPVPLTGDWLNDPNDGGTQDWYVDVNGTGSTGTGPAVDQSLGTATGVYLYVEDSNTPNGTGDVTLLTPLIDLSGAANPILSFWVHANDSSGVGVNNNTLHVDIIDITASSTTADIVTPIQHIPDATLTVWTQFTADLSAFAGNVIQVRFRVDDAGASFTHDIALDTVEIFDPAEMDVLRGATPVADGGTDNVDILTAGTNLTYTIENNGAVDLNLTGTPEVVVTPGTNVATVTVTTAPTTPVSASGSTTFVINVTATAAGPYDFTVSIDNDDPNENPYDFTVSGNAVSNVPPAVANQTGSNWVDIGGNVFTLTLNPGDAISDTLEATDVTPDNMTVTITAAPTFTGLTAQPTDITTPTAGPISLTWTGTADASNAPGNYDWTIDINDGTTTTSITARIIINNVAPTHTAVTGVTGDGLSAGTQYVAGLDIGSSAVINIADATDANVTDNIAVSGQTAVTVPGGSTLTFTFSTSNSNPTVLQATPSAAAALADLGDHDYTVDLSDGTNTVTVFVRITVTGTAPVITSAAAPTQAADGGSFSHQFTATGNPAPTFAVTTGTLPAWATLTPAGLLSGTPVTGQDINVTVSAQNGIAPDATEVVNITVVTGVAPAITSSAAPTTATVGTLYTHTFTASGTPTPTFSAAGLPAWLTFTPATGVLSGTPAAGDVGTTGTITITAANGVTPDATEAFTITVSAAGGSSSGDGDGDDDGGCSTGTNGFNWLALLGLLGVVAIALRARAAKA